MGGGNGDEKKKRPTGWEEGEKEDEGKRTGMGARSVPR
jgi:hypothetical protein